VESGDASEAKHTRKEEIAESLKSPGEITPIGPPPVMSFQAFAIDSANLKKEHEEFLAELVAALRHASAHTLRLVIVGHADATGVRLKTSLCPSSALRLYGEYLREHHRWRFSQRARAPAAR
jgi:hypothetical protein